MMSRGGPVVGGGTFLDDPGAGGGLVVVGSSVQLPAPKEEWACWHHLIFISVSISTWFFSAGGFV